MNNRRKMHFQVLTNIDDTDNQNIARGATDLIIRAVDSVSLPPSRLGCIDFKMMGCQLEDETVNVYLHAETMAHDISKIQSYFIFVNKISDLDNTHIKIKNNGKLPIPKFDSRGHHSREINPKNEIILIVANKNFTVEEIEKAKDYAQKNGLTYVAECDLTNNDDIYETINTLVRKSNQLEKVMELEKKKKLGMAYTRGAVSGTFKGILPREISQYIGSFLSPNNIGSLMTRKAAVRRAEAEKDREEKKFKR